GERLWKHKDGRKGPRPNHMGEGPAAHPLVVATAVLRWGPVAAAPSGAARVQLAHHAMLRVFGRRLRLAAPPAGTPAPMVCPLDLALTGTAWVRFLNELLTCGLLDAAPFSSSAALQLAIDRLDVSPAALEVKEPDLLPVGGLAAAAALAGDAAHAQRGAPRRASAAASAARPAAAVAPAPNATDAERHRLGQTVTFRSWPTELAHGAGPRRLAHGAGPRSWPTWKVAGNAA
ncbi:hypothetical protein EMIHUDRAFT_123235, partial [Emiliania huxleyi CCMP1516]|uniref:Uncharacterized protein n=2 Tax=Emiliania huxleyi TaxID=2903 RepID=A0A0D3K159_EMIH1